MDTKQTGNPRLIAEQALRGMWSSKKWPVLQALIKGHLWHPQIKNRNPEYAFRSFVFHSAFYCAKNPVAMDLICRMSKLLPEYWFDVDPETNMTIGDIIIQDAIEKQACEYHPSTGSRKGNNYVGIDD